jgi:NADP-dependent 3-hydroxy acid dehydrogenase YdfG
MTNHIEHKSIIITGAGGGFGRLAAQRLAELGAKLTCADIDAVAVEETAESIREAGGTAIAVTADVCSIEDMRTLAARAVETHGAIDVMVNNAGIMPLAFLADHEAALDAWTRCIDINFKGVMNGTVAVYDQMIAQGRGHVINMSSIFGNKPVVGAAVYGATKAAVNFFSDSIRQESRGKIKVTVIRPTGVRATALAKSVINGRAVIGALGPNQADYFAAAQQLAEGTAPPEWNDADSIEYSILEPEYITQAVVQVIDQPWGVAISDVTVRTAGDYYVM